MQAIWKWSLAFQCVVNIGVRGSETVRTRVVEAGMVPVTVGVLESYLKMVDTHKQETKKEDRERESRERREERERQRRADRAERTEMLSRGNGRQVSNSSTATPHQTTSNSQRMAVSSTDRSTRLPRENYIEEVSENQATSSNSTSRSNRQSTSTSTPASRMLHSDPSDVTMRIDNSESSLNEFDSVISVGATTNAASGSGADEIGVVEAGSSNNRNVSSNGPPLSSFSDATSLAMSLASGSGTLTNVSSVEDLRSGSGSGSGSEGAEDAAMDADAEGDGDGSSLEDDSRPIVSSARRNTVQQSHFSRPQMGSDQSADADAGADADTEMEGSAPLTHAGSSNQAGEPERSLEEEEGRTPRPARRALAGLSSTSIIQETSPHAQVGPSSTPMDSTNHTITPSTTRQSRQQTTATQSQPRPNMSAATPPQLPTQPHPNRHAAEQAAADQVQVTRAPPAININNANASSLNGGEMAYREEEVLLSLQLLAYLSKYAHVRVLFHNAEMAVTALPGPLSALDGDFDMLPVAQACSEKHDRSSGCTSKAEDSNAPPARNVFSVAERFTLRSSRSGSSVSATAHSKLAPEIQYWAGVIMRNACRKDEGRGGIRQCANMLCGKWEAYPREFAKCRRCRKAKYCSKACQSKGWQMGHRFWCSAREDEGREKEREKEKSGTSNGREDGNEGAARGQEGDQEQQRQPIAPSINNPTDENADPSTGRSHLSSSSSHGHHHHHHRSSSNTGGSSSVSESNPSRRDRRQEGSSSHAGSSRRRASGLLNHANADSSFAAASASTSDVDTDTSMTTAPVGGIEIDDADAASTGRDSEEEVRRSLRPRAGRSQLSHQRQHAHQPLTSDGNEDEHAHPHSHGPLPPTQRTDLAGRPLPPPVIASHDPSHVLGTGGGRNDELDMGLLGGRGTPGATHEAEGLFANGDFDQMRWRSNTLTPGSRNQALPDVDTPLVGSSTSVLGEGAFAVDSNLATSSSSSSSSSASYSAAPPAELRAPVARQPHRFASTSGAAGLSGLGVSSGAPSGFIPGHSHTGSSSSIGIGLGQPSSPSYAHFQRGYGLEPPGPRSASSAADFPPSSRSHASTSSPSPLSAGPEMMNSSFLPRSTSQPTGLDLADESLQSQDEAMNVDQEMHYISRDEDIQMN